MKRMTGLWRSCLTALLLWCAWPALAAELPPSPGGCQGRGGDPGYPPELFLPGLAHGRGEAGGHVAGAELLSAEWKYSDEEWPVALEQGAEGRQTRRPLWHPSRGGRGGPSAAPAGIKQLFELQGWKEAPREHLARWQQLVHPLLAGGLAGRQAGHRRPRGGSGRCSRWTGDPQGLSAEPHSGSRLHRHQPAGRGAAVEQGL